LLVFEYAAWTINWLLSGHKFGSCGGTELREYVFEHCCSGHGIITPLLSGLQDPTYDNYRYKRSLGTPSSQIVTVPGNMPGAMVDRHGNLVVRTVDL